MKERVAIIDLGTNTFHLLIAELSASMPPRILHREKQAVKVGLGGINQGVITDAALQRALTCLRNFKKTMGEWNVGQTKAIGTSALRSALNGEEIVKIMGQDTGIVINLISGDQEAEYIYFGVRSAFDLGFEKSLIVDIGGGSVEFIIGNCETIFWKQSFDIGAQRLLEKFQRHDPIAKEETESLNRFFDASLGPLLEQLRQHQPRELVGSSGTFDTLSEIYCLRNNIPYDGSPETPLSLPGFDEIFKEFLTKNRTERLKIPGMIEMRVDMIVVACCLIKFLITRSSFQKVRVSTFSLKEGVLATMA